MWLITQHGFYSIALDRSNSTRHRIAAACESDLRRLKTLAGLEARIQQSTEENAEWFVSVEDKELVRVMNALGNTIDYPCFQSRLAWRPEQAPRGFLYGRVLSLLRQVTGLEKPKEPKNLSENSWFWGRATQQLDLQALQAPAWHNEQEQRRLNKTA